MPFFKKILLRCFHAFFSCLVEMTLVLKRSSPIVLCSWQPLVAFNLACNAIFHLNLRHSSKWSKQHQFHFSKMFLRFFLPREDPTSLGVVARKANWCFGHAPRPHLLSQTYSCTFCYSTTTTSTIATDQSPVSRLEAISSYVHRVFFKSCFSICLLSVRQIFPFLDLIGLFRHTIGQILDTSFWMNLPYLKKGGRIPIDRLEDLQVEDNSIISSTTLIRFSVFKAFCDHSSYYIICLEALFGWNLYDNFRIISIQIGHATFFSNWSQIRESLGILSVVWRTVGVRTYRYTI